MAPERFTPEQKRMILKALENGSSQTELAEFYHCRRETISRIVKNNGSQRAYDQWSEEAEAMLREQLKAEPRHTTAQIAAIINEKLGTRLTRGAITGKTKRLGLSSCLNKGRPKSAKPKATPRFTVPRRIRNAPPLVSTLDNTDSLNVSLIDLEDGMCKWMTGNALYCGHVTAGRRVSYCTKHHNAGMEPAKFPVGMWRSSR